MSVPEPTPDQRDVFGRLAVSTASAWCVCVPLVVRGAAGKESWVYEFAMDETSDSVLVAERGRGETSSLAGRDAGEPAMDGVCEAALWPRLSEQWRIAASD